jgi:GMP synthase-like glutamine amidotransferase
MSVNDDAELPWLTAEKRLIADSVRAGVPYFGACLGVQLLAASLGARVYSGPEPEVGVLPVSLTAEGVADPLFAGLPQEFPTLQWHGDTFDLPDGATLLASSPAYPNQAFRFGRLAYGVQFHVEVLPDMAREWATVPEYVGYADRVLGAGGMERLLAEFDTAEAAMRATGRSMFARWAELAVPVAG